MSHISLTFEGVNDADQVNRLTTALMMVDGVESAEVEGRVRHEALIAAVEKLGVKVR